MGILNWFKKGKGSDKKTQRQSSSQKAPQLVESNSMAFVLLSEPMLPEISDLQIDFHQLAPEGLTIEPADNEDEGEQGNSDDGSEILSFKIEAVGNIFVKLTPVAIPDYESEGAREFSIGAYRNEKAAAPQSHYAHLLISMLPETALTPVRRMTVFTALIAAVLKSTPATEVYWGNAGATHEKEVFLSFAEMGKQDQAILIMLWNGLSRAMEDDGRISFLSLGMHQLGLPNLYLIAPQEKYGEAFEWVWDLLNYVVTKGEAISAGDTVEVSEGHHLEVEYVKTPTGEDEVVWKIEI